MRRGRRCSTGQPAKSRCALPMWGTCWAASVSLRIAEPGRTPEIIVFSGDIGNTHQPLIKDPSNPGHADYLVMESTYGGPQPRPETGLYRRFERRAAIDVRQGRQCRHPQLCRGPHAGAFVFYPPDQGRGPYQGNHENFPVFVDSPLASKSTTIFRENFAECYDDEALALVQSGQNPCSSRVCTSARRKRNPWPSTATRRPRSSSPPPACATRAASATT